MKMYSLKRGFTLIELLVVVAIIGILASVVLASLNSARGKGANAAVKSNLANIRSQAELVYNDSNPNSYNTVCNGPQDPNISAMIIAAHKASGASGAVVLVLATAQTSATTNCQAVSTQWAASSPLKTAEGAFLYWCVDSTGASEGRVSPLAANAAVCPAT